MQTKQSLMLAQLLDLVVSAVTIAGPHGVPEGHLYAQLMVLPGFTIQHFNNLMTAMVDVGVITRSGNIVKARS